VKLVVWRLVFLCGGILIALAHRLRNSYRNFSSILAGGGLAFFILPFTLAFQQFQLFKQPTAFVIMIVITIFAVVLLCSTITGVGNYCADWWFSCPF